DEDSAVLIDVIANDYDNAGLLLPSSVTVIDQPVSGTVSVNTATGVITYTPTADYFGDDAFSYQITDTLGKASNIAMIDIIILPINDAPLLTPDVVEIQEDTQILINVLNNDIDIDDLIDVTTLNLVTQSQNGTLTLATTEEGGVIYHPNLNFVGSDSFSYQVTDEAGSVGQAVEVIINVAGSNDAPIAQDDSVTTAEDSEVALNIISNDTDIEDTSVQVSNINILTQPVNGILIQDPQTAEFSYLPEQNYNGQDSFSYLVTDTEGASSNSATVTISISPVEDAPEALNDTVVLFEDVSHVINVLGNDFDTEKNIDITSIEIINSPAQGTVAVDSVNGHLIYQPNQNFYGSDELTYQISDTTGLSSNQASVLLTIESVNDLPLANSDQYELVEDIEQQLTILDNDQDIDGQLDLTSLIITTAPDFGKLTINYDGSVTYVSALNYAGVDSFSYQIADNEAGISEQTLVELTITNADDIPKFTSEPVTTNNEDEAYSYQISTIEFDNEAVVITAELSTEELPDWLSFVDHQDGTASLMGVPTEAEVGEYQIVLTAMDVNQTATTQAYTLSVLAVNDAPVILIGDTAVPALELELLEDNSAHIQLALEDSDSTEFEWKIVVAPEFGEVTVEKGAVIYIPETNYVGIVSFEISVSDGD
ncbi:MAG: tandem-95 repeat protein, partial [Colwellia sp.]